MNINSKDIFISVGLGVYNEEKRVSNMLDSILLQSHNNFELIISDDCSNDQTYEICEKYSLKDERITLYRQKKNLGVVKNLDFLLGKSRHNYFIYLAGDDVISSNYLEANLKNLIENPECACSSGASIWEDQDLEKDKVTFELDKDLYQRLKDFLSNSFKATAMNYAIYRKEIMENCPDLKKKFFGHDWKIMCNALKHGKFLRQKNSLITLGRGGISSAPEFMRSEENKVIEIILPLYEFSKYFFKNFVINSKLKLTEKSILFYKLVLLNLHLSFMKIINLARFTLKKNPHNKIGPAYKK